MLPKVQDAQQVVALDLLLTQIEKTMGFEVGKIGIEAQIENAQGLNNVNEIAPASPRVETIIFGPADFMASINMKSLVVGEQPPGYPADAYHYILMKILMAARANNLQAIDGPYLQIRNVDGYREVARRAAALGFDGKWVLHPGQVEASNEIFSPSQEDYDHAELILDAYDYYTSEAGGKKGSAMLGDEMIDEASRKMALVISGKGRAAGMQRTRKFEIPGGVSTCSSGAPTRSSRSGRRLQALAREDGHGVRRPPLLSAHHEPPPAPHGHELRGEDDRLRQERRRRATTSTRCCSACPCRTSPARRSPTWRSSRCKHVAPTFHGDTIYGETTVLDKTPSKSKNDRGIVHVETKGYKQDGTLVCVFRRKVMVPTETYIKERGGEQPGRPELREQEK